MLLDTHTLLWFLNDDTKLIPNIKQKIEQASNAYVSIISIWEIAIKIGIGKLNVEFEFQDLPEILLQLDIETLPITFEDTKIYLELPFHHRDPFDRMLIAQAIHRNFLIVSCDEVFDKYLVQRIWDREGIILG
ncbi:PIN domain-containing protein [Tumidithrix helvetica PCC 7403]|uniref:type II toxin-antitoxin system VapC family toxin n=1 Tax=Tumidithrix helvetica TaxID=3457545 RepID=UPI003C9C7722